MPTQPTIVASVDAGTFSSRTVTTGTIPSWTPQLNDLVGVLVNMPQSTPIPMTMPPGWANALSSSAGSPSGANTVVVYHLVTAGEVSAATTSWTLTNLFDSSESGRQVSFVVRGVNPAAPIDVSAGAGGVGNPFTSPSLAPTKTGCLVVAGGGGNSFSTSTTYGSPSAPWSSVAGLYSGTNLAFVAQCSTPTVSGVAFPGLGLSVSRSDDWAAATVAFAPIPDPPSGGFFAFF